MGIDECAIIPDDFTDRTSLTAKPAIDSKKIATSNENIKSNDKSPSNQSKRPTVQTIELTIDQLKSGFTANSTLYQASNDEKKEVTFLELYQALNKQPTPSNLLKLKYDWIVTLPNDPVGPNTSVNNISPNQPINMFSYFYSQHNNNMANQAPSNNSSSSSSLFTLSSFHNQQQRFYIDTLASVAASFLNDLQKPKNTNENNANNNSASGHSQAANSQNGSKSAANIQSANQSVRLIFIIKRNYEKYTV
jgi:hypothetical protein